MGRRREKAPRIELSDSSSEESDNEEGALDPLQQPIKRAKKRRRRPSFRPSRSKSRASATSCSKPAPPEPQVPGTAAEPEASRTADEPLNENVTAVGSETAEDVLKPAASVDNPGTPVEASAKCAAESPVKRPRKRKKMGVAVGTSRPGIGVSIAGSRPSLATAAHEESSNFLPPEHHEDGKPAAAVDNTTSRLKTATPLGDTSPDDPDAAVLAQEVGEAPRLNSFCSRFKSRRRKSDKAAAPPPQKQSNSDKPDENTKATEQRTAGPIVQIVNGEIVLQESSMVVNSSTTKPEDEFSVVEEEAQLAVVGASYNSFVKRKKPQHWSVEETQRFYEALRQFGTDFGTMEIYFDSKRSRKQLKRKFQVESTRNPQLVERALDPTARIEIGRFLHLA